MYRDFGWKFWVIGFVALVIIGIPVITRTPAQLGLDLQGGTMLTYRLETDEPGDFDVVLQVLQKRLDILGMRQLVIRKEGPQDFVIQVPGIDVAEIERIKHLVSTSGVLWFKTVAKKQNRAEIDKIFEWKEQDRYDPESTYDIALNKTADDEVALPKEDPASYRLIDNAGAVPGRLLKRAYPTTDDFNNPAVGFTWNAEGARLFGDLTEKNKGGNLAIILDGVVESAPTVDERIGARGIIKGRFTQQEVNDLVIILQGGSLPSKPNLESDLTIGPGLGRDSVERGKVATLLSLLLVVGFMVIYYRGAGVVAALTLLFNLALLLCILIDFEATLTLPGIAGIVLTVGMAIDANILIFERIREEKNKGMGLRQAVENGYGRAFWTIFDANLTTLITAVILFQVGTGPIKGFAVTLSIGILTSMFSALFVTKAIFTLLIVKGWMTSFKMLTLVRDPNVDFRRYRGITIFLSLVVIVAGMTVFVSRGQEKYGIEFTGGALFQIKLKRPMAASEIRDRLDSIGAEFENAEVQAVTYVKPGDQVPEDGEGEEGAESRDLPGREGYEFQIRVRMTPRVLVPAEVRREIEEGLKDLIEPGVLEPLLDAAFAAQGGLEAARAALKVSLEESIDPIEVTPVLRDAFSETVDPSKLKPMLDDAFVDVLAPDPFPELRAREAVQMDPNDKGRGKIALAVRLDPRIKAPPDMGKLEAELALAGLEECEVETWEEEGSEVIAIKVTTGTSDLSSPVKISDLRQQLSKFFKDSVEYPVSEAYPRVIDIGRSVAYNLKSKAILAMVFAIMAIILYITFRFEFKFSIAAITALVHDVLIAMGVVATVDALGIMDLKIDLAMVTAFLTIIGYSLNDTIVVFDRIRENLGSRKKLEYSEMINSSINQTLSRTLLTSLTTFVALLALFLAGVNVIQDFSFAMIIGVIVGTYSSIFIASPVLVYLRNREVASDARAVERQTVKA